MKKVSFALLILTICAFNLTAQTRKPQRIAKPKPKIYSIAKDPVAKVEDKTFGLTVERYIANYEVNADGSAVQTVELLQRLNSETAVARFSKFEKLFNADLQTAEVQEAYILKPDGKKTPVAPDKIQTVLTPQAEAAPAFSSLKTVKIDFDGVTAGDAVFLKLKMTEKPIFAGHFSAGEILQGLFDWKFAEINLTAPANYQLFIEAVDLTGGKLEDKGDGKSRWQWRRENFAARELELGTIGATDFSPRLAVTSFKNYEELGAAYWENAKTKAVVTPAVQKLADEITKNISDPKEQAAAIYEWTNKNIRYLLVILGRGGWISHSTEQILANGYGDCKDYTTLLQALLAAKNIESHPFLINSDGGFWSPGVAAPDFFNHAILYIPSLNMFADATAPNTRLGLLPQVLLGKSGFLGGQRTGKITIPLGKPEDNQLLSEANVTFTADGSVRAVSKNSYVGRAEMFFRPIFADSRLQNSDAFVKVLLAMHGINGTGRLLKISDPHSVGASFDIEAEINLNDYTTFLPNGKLTVPIAITLHNPLMLEMLVTEEQRKNDLTFGATTIRQSYTMRFPDKVSIAVLPLTVKFENVAGHYRSEFKTNGNSVVLTRELVVIKDLFTPKDYPALRELVKKAVEDYNSEIAYRADGSFLRNKSTAMRKQPPKTTDDMFERLLSMDKETPLTPREAVQLEARLNSAPDDVETRKRLLRYHYNRTLPDVKTTRGGKKRIVKSSAAQMSAAEQARYRHHLWFIQNHPEMSKSELYGIHSLAYYDDESQEYKALRDEWLKQVAARKSDAQVRLNAVEFINCTDEIALCENLLRESKEIFADDYRFALKMFELFEPDLTESKEVPGAVTVKTEVVKEAKKPLSESLAQGEAVLILLKKERSSERDNLRAELLQKLAKIAFKLDNFDRSRQFANELVLEFGDDVNDFNYDNATHVGNIILGRIALRENDVKRAKEHLLIAARAPQRARVSYLRPEMTLAEELFQRGEKDAVSEYLKLCEAFESPDKTVLRKWQDEIKSGKTPSFNAGEL